MEVFSALMESANRGQTRATTWLVHTHRCGGLEDYPSFFLGATLKKESLG
jgi:hypothetical protein